MKIERLFLYGFISFFFGLSLISSSGPSLAATINVPADYSTIQAGIDAASNGDTVLVADGTYTGAGNKNLDYKGKAITIQSENGPDNCVIDCENDGRGVYFYGYVGADSVISGFTIKNAGGTNGYGIQCSESSPTISNCTISGNSLGGISCNSSSDPTISDCTIGGNSGSGITCSSSSPSITNSTITGNTASSGGGISCWSSSSPSISNCTINQNVTTSTLGGKGGGGIYCSYSSPTISDCAINNNITQGSGGGILFYETCSPSVINCEIQNNTARSSGGGIKLFNRCSAEIINCNVSYNTSNTAGGGIAGQISSPTITNCVIIGNVVTDSAGIGSGEGGGIIFSEFGDNGSFWSITNSIISQNAADTNGGGIVCGGPANIVNSIISNNTSIGYGGGIYINGFSPNITNCTISKNTANGTGGGIYCDESSAIITNSIFWADSPDEVYTQFSFQASFTYSDIQGGYSGTGNIDSNPLFVGSGDYYLTTSSPCINVGNNSAPNLPDTDKDGNPRIIDGIVDMGAYERLLAPTVTTHAASSVTSTSATLNGTVNPNGASTTAVFEYGNSASYGDSVTATENPLTGGSTQSVSADLAGLTPGKNYHFRAKATNSEGTVYGSDVSFTTSYASAIYVSINGDCGDKTPCYDSIQDAINAAATGSEILIAEGTYTESITLNESKTLTIKGGWNSAFTGQTSNTTFIKAPKATQGSLTLQVVTIKP